MSTVYPEGNIESEKHIYCNSDCCICPPKHPKPSKILLECGCHPQDAIFEIRRGRVRRRQEYVLDKVVVDTSCLCRPQVKVEFSSIVYFEAEARGRYGRAKTESETEVEVENFCGEQEVDVALLFELVRVCDGVEEIVQSWNYEKDFQIRGTRSLQIEISEPFTVTYCDRECPGCCSYKMKVSVRRTDGRFKALRVVCPNISALAQGICGN